jgi:hypothetical protein
VQVQEAVPESKGGKAGGEEIRGMRLWGIAALLPNCSNHLHASALT